MDENLSMTISDAMVRRMERCGDEGGQYGISGRRVRAGMRGEQSMSGAENEKAALYIGRVETRGGELNVREAPGGNMIGRLANGEEADVLGEEGQWLQIAYGEGIGYVSKSFMVWAKSAGQTARLIIEDEEGNVFIPAGGFTVKMHEGAID